MLSLIFHLPCVLLVTCGGGPLQCVALHSTHLSYHHILHVYWGLSKPFLVLSIPSKAILTLLAIIWGFFLYSSVHPREQWFFVCCMNLRASDACFRSLSCRTKSYFEIVLAQLLLQESIHPFLELSKHYQTLAFISFAEIYQQIVLICQLASWVHFWVVHFTISSYW